MPSPFDTATADTTTVSVPTFQTLKPGDVKLSSIACLYGPSGVGKTSALAHIPGVAMVLPSGELGYQTLLKRSLVPSVPFVQVDRWEQLRELTLQLSRDCSAKVLVFDSLTPIERMCHEHVCRREYRGEWGEKGFGAFKRGYDVSVPEWRLWLSDLERIRVDQRVPIILVGHSEIRTVSNPMGDNYDQVVPSLHFKTWAATRGEMDHVLYYTYLTVLDDQRRGGPKGVGGQQRVIYTKYNDAYDAKNRAGMPEVLDVPDDPAQVWPVIQNAMKGGESK